MDMINITQSMFSGMPSSTRRRFGQQPLAPDKAARLSRLVALEVIEQVCNLDKTPVIQDAWKAGRRTMIRGWVLDLASGLLRRQMGEINGNHAVRDVCKFRGAGAGARA